MKKLILTIVCAVVLDAIAFAQGLVNFINSPTTLVTLRTWDGPLGPTPPVAGQFYFQLFVAPQGTTIDGPAFTPTILGTNVAGAGRFSGGANVPVPGILPGSTGAILVRGWSVNLGADYGTAYVNWSFGSVGFLGSSSIAPNFNFGGFDGTSNWPSFLAFGGANGIQSGFELFGVPEPSALALTGLGWASFILFGRPNQKP